MTEERKQEKEKINMTKDQFQIRLDKKMREYLDEKANENYCTAAEYIRRLIVVDMQKQKKESPGD